MNIVAGSATAEPPAAGCCSDRDRMGQLVQSKLVGEPLTALDQGLGR